MNERDEKAGEMQAEYDFTRGERGKHARDYRNGHLIRVAKANGTVEECHYTLEEGAVMLDSDLRVQFPDSESVNRALREYLTHSEGR